LRGNLLPVLASDKTHLLFAGPLLEGILYQRTV
jgi:hypothetical protein